MTVISSTGFWNNTTDQVTAIRLEGDNGTPGFLVNTRMIAITVAD